jgi:predicted Zn-dependent protease
MKQSPNDPYLYDLKGQVVFERGRVSEAVEYYRFAAKQLPNNPIIHADFGRALLAMESPASVAEATSALEHATSLDRTHVAAWDLLAVAYGKGHQTAKAALAQAEAALLRNKPHQAIVFLNQAKPKLAPNTPASLHAEDLRAQADQQLKAKRDNER